MKLIHKLNGIVVFIILIVDMINGFFLNQGLHFPISQLFKLLVTMSLLIGLSNLSINKALFWVIISSTLIILPTLPNLLEGELNFFYQNLIHSQKFFFTVLTYLYFGEYFKKGYNLNLKAVIAFNLTILLINICLTYVGLGYTAYQTGAGATGYFYSANELSFVALIIFSNLIFLAFLSNTRWFFLAGLGSFIFSVLMGMKICIIGTILVFFMLLLRKKGKGVKVVFLTFIILCLIVLYNEFGIIIEPLIDRWIYMYHKSDGLFAFFLSGRDTFLMEKYDAYMNQSFYVLVFGMGKNLTVEMDFFDTLFNYGIYGLLTVYGFYTIVITNSFLINNSEKRAFGTFLAFLIVVASGISGHFFFSAMAGFFFSFFNAYNQNAKAFS